jgi:hypothetical protein
VKVKSQPTPAVSTSAVPALKSDPNLAMNSPALTVEKTEPALQILEMSSNLVPVV